MWIHLLLSLLLFIIKARGETVLRPNLYFGTRSRTEQSHLVFISIKVID